MSKSIKIFEGVKIITENKIYNTIDMECFKVLKANDETKTNIIRTLLCCGSIDISKYVNTKKLILELITISDTKDKDFEWTNIEDIY